MPEPKATTVKIELDALGRDLVTGEDPPFEVVWNPRGSDPTFQGPWLKNRKTGRLVRKLEPDEYIVR
jgi:hypothetical protein